MSAHSFSLRPLGPDDRPWLRDLLAAAWGLPVVTPRLVYGQPELLPGLVADLGGERVGAVTHAPDGRSWEIVTVNVTVPRQGIGTALLHAVRDEAWRAGADRLWLITTEDNGSALAFYASLGMRQVRVHEAFAEVVRRHKPGVDLPFQDAIELEWRPGG